MSCQSVCLSPLYLSVSSICLSIYLHLSIFIYLLVDLSIFMYLLIYVNLHSSTSFSFSLQLTKNVSSVFQSICFLLSSLVFFSSVYVELHRLAVKQSRGIDTNRKARYAACLFPSTLAVLLLSSSSLSYSFVCFLVFFVSLL